MDKKSLHIIECCEDEVCPNSKIPKTMPQLIASMKAEKNKKQDSSPPKKKILPHLHPLVTEYRRSLQQKRPASELEGIVESKETTKKSPADSSKMKTLSKISKICFIQLMYQNLMTCGRPCKMNVKRLNNFSRTNLLNLHEL